jgi:IS5 family transposase
MARSPGFFDLEERLALISAKGDDLERLAEVVDFEAFRADLVNAVPRSDGAKGGRPAYDPVMMFKILILQGQNGLSDARAEFYIRDRLSWMRFLGLSLADPTPDANTIWIFREALKNADAIEALFARFEAQLREAGFLPMAGQLVDATIVAAPKQRMTDDEKAAVKRGETPEEWAENPAKAAQKDKDARWTVKYSKAKPAPDGAKRVDIAVPSFGYKNHVAIDREHGLIRGWSVTAANAHDGAQLMGVLDKSNTGSAVWADSAYRSGKNETALRKAGYRSLIHRKKPQGKPMPRNVARANAKKSSVRSAVEHVFAEQKHRRGLFVRTIGATRAKLKIGLANLAYNMRRAVWLTGRTAVV